jgi:hypothetical protein
MPLEPVPDQGAIRFQTHRDAGGVLNAAFALLRRNAREVFVGFLAIVGPVYIASAILQALYFARLEQAANDPELVLDVGRFLASVLPAILAVGLMGLFASVVGQAAAGAYVRLYRSGMAGEVSVGLLWDETRSLLLPIALLNLAIGLGVAATALINVVPCLGQIAWLAFLVWVFPVVSVMVPARVLESPSVGAAWTRARELVKGSWGFAFGSLLLAYIVLVVISVAVAIPAEVAALVVGVNSLDGGPTGGLTVIQILFSPLQLIVAAAYLVPLLVGFFIHGRLVEELEGSSLDEGLDALAAALPASEWEGGPRSTPPAEPEPPASTPPPASAPEHADEEPPRSGFRGGGFGEGA